MNRKGKLYGVGTGPGDPELLTLKAVRTVKEADIIAIPNDDPENCIPWKTVTTAVPEIRKKKLLKVPFLMEKDLEARKAVRKQNAGRIAALLDQGLNVAFLTIGDPSIYTTYSYVSALLSPQGYLCEMISGVPSFCGASARLNITLCSDQEKLEIIPGGGHAKKKEESPSGDPVEEDPETSPPSEGSGHPGCGSGATQIYMKYESQFPDLIAELDQRGEDPLIIENCCLEGERAFKDHRKLPADIGYFNIVISHNDGKSRR